MNKRMMADVRARATWLDAAGRAGLRVILRVLASLPGSCCAVLTFRPCEGTAAAACGARRKAGSEGIGKVQ